MEKIYNNEHEISFSDAELKENITLLEKYPIEKVKEIVFKSFNYKNDENKTKVHGVIAQDLLNADLGEIVYTNEDGHLAVDYTSLFVLKLASLDDYCSYILGKYLLLEKEFNKLKEEVGNLKKENENLKK